MRSMISEAKLTKRFNTGDFQFEEYSLGAVVDEKESGAEVLTELKKQINEVFTGEVAVETNPPAKVGKKAEKKNGKGKPASAPNDEDANHEDPPGEDAGASIEGVEDDEASDGEDGDDGDDSSVDGEEDSDGAEDPTPPAKAGKGGKEASGKGGKKYVKKPQDYNRSIEEHKNIFSRVLGSVSPDWKKNDVLKAKAKKASESLEGESFLDENGEVLDSFKALVRNLMKVKK